MARYEVFYKGIVDDFRFGGTVEAESAEDVFEKVQNLWDGHEVKDVLGRNDRSLSVDDVVRVDGRAFLVEACGFSPYEGELPGTERVVTFEEETDAYRAQQDRR